MKWLESFFDKMDKGRRRCAVVAIVILAVLILVLLFAIIPVVIYTSVKTSGRAEMEPLQPVDPFRKDNSTDLFDDDFSTSLMVPPNVTSCSKNGFSCVGVPSIIIGKNQVCDGKPDCPDGSDEADCDHCLTSFSCQAKLGSNKLKCLRGNAICDGVPDCADHSDELAYCRSNCGPNEYQCKGNKRCIPDSFRCDGNDHCPLGDDESNCESCTKGARYCKATRKCIPVWNVCNGIVDCPDQSDEKDCNCDTCSSGEVALCEGESTNTCIQRKDVCDGIRQCSGGEDEEGCAGKCSISTGSLPDADVRCEDGSRYTWKYACSGLYPQCNDACDDCNTELAFQCSDESACVHRSKLCDGRPDCADGSDEHNCKLVHDTCNDQSKRCDSFKDCSDGRDEQGCTECKSPSFHCAKENKCIPSHERCDGVEQCSDGSDETNCTCAECSIHPYPMYYCDSGNRCFHMDDVCAPHSRCPEPTRRDKMFCAIRDRKFF